MKHETVSNNAKPDHRHETVKVSQKGMLYSPEKDAFLLVKISSEKGFFVEHYGPWDLPGGRVNTGEPVEEALLREIREEIGEVETGEWRLADRTMIEYPDGKVLLLGFVAPYLSGDIVLSHEHSEYRWMRAEEIAESAECGDWLKRFVASAAERLKEREYLNDAKRMYADFENYKRRQEERMKELSAMCAEGFAHDLVPVIDNFRMAALHAPEEEKGNAWMIGITHIGRQLEEVLATHGVSAFEAKEGEMFDPYLHEAIGKEGDGDGRIVKALAPGYKIGNRVVRAAKVMVN